MVKLFINIWVRKLMTISLLKYIVKYILRCILLYVGEWRVESIGVLNNCSAFEMP